MRSAVARLPSFLSIPKLAAETGLPASSIYAAVSRGELPAVRMTENRGRGPCGMRVAEADFLRWIDSRREVAT